MEPVVLLFIRYTSIIENAIEETDMKLYTKADLEKMQNDVFFFLSEKDELKAGTKGIAKIRYQEGSIYTGPVEFTGKSFEKIGYGCQDFTESTITCDSVGGPIGDTLYLYEGMYDYKVTQWIHGDGVFYFLKDGKPDCYCAGYFAGTSFIKDYQGKDLDLLLLPAFRNAKRLTSLHPNQKRIHDMIRFSKTRKNVRFMFVGDSYFDFLNTHYDENGRSLTDVYSKGNSLVNYGIGGFRFCDFIPFIDQLVINSQPESIIVNLGFNDVHCGKTNEETLNDCRHFIKIIKKSKKDVKIYLLGVCHFPLFTNFREVEDDYNSKLEQIVCEFDNVFVIHSEDVFDDIFDKNENWMDYIEPDLIHPNNNGYRIWMPRFLKEVKGYILPKGI